MNPGSSDSPGGIGTPTCIRSEDAKTDTGFCIYGKPAEKVVKEWYSKPR